MKIKLLLLALSLAAHSALAQPPLPAAEAKSKIENPKSKIPQPYPLKVCLVTDNDLDSMGDEVSIVYQGQTIKFCCKPCEKKFLRAPEKYLVKLAPKEPEKK